MKPLTRAMSPGDRVETRYKENGAVKTGVITAIVFETGHRNGRTVQVQWDSGQPSSRCFTSDLRRLR